MAAAVAAALPLLRDPPLLLLALGRLPSLRLPLLLDSPNLLRLGVPLLLGCAGLLLLMPLSRLPGVRLPLLGGLLHAVPLSFLLRLLLVRPGRRLRVLAPLCSLA